MSVVESAAKQQLNIAETVAYLETLYGRCSVDDGEIVVVSPTKNYPLGVYKNTELVRAAKCIASEQGAYIKVNLMDWPAMMKRRDQKRIDEGNPRANVVGKACEVKTIVSIHLDADAGKTSKYHTRERMLECLNAMPHPPSLIVNSDGAEGGFHAYWLFEKPLRIETDEDRKKVEEAAERWQARLNKIADGKLDSTANIDRVLRPIGSVRKGTGNVVSMHDYDPERLYSIESLTLPPSPTDQKPESAKARNTQSDRPIDQFIESSGITVESLLIENGYSDLGGGDWLRPGSESGNRTLTLATKADVPGINVFSGCDPFFKCDSDRTAIGTFYSLATMFVIFRFAGVYDDAAGWCRDAMRPDAKSVFDEWGTPSETFTADELIERRGCRRDLAKEPASVPMIDRAAFALDALQTANIDPLDDAGGKRWSWKAAELCFLYGLSRPAAVAVFQAAAMLDDAGTDGKISNASDQKSLRGEWPENEIHKRIRNVERFTDGIFGEALTCVLAAETWETNQRLARRVLAKHGYDVFDESKLRLRFWRGEFYAWDGLVYRKVSIEHIENVVTSICHEQRLIESAESIKRHDAYVAKCREENKDPKPYKPPIDIYKPKVNAVIAAMRTICTVDEATEMPAWLGLENMPPAESVLSCRNGIYAIDGDEVTMVTPKPQPAFFSTSGLAFDYDAAASCPTWTRTLGEYWQHDPEAVGLLKQWFGYHLVPDLPHHKMLVVIGPKRSGKGTIREILGEIAGVSAVTTPKLSELGQQFGLQNWPGKRAAFMADARMGRNTDTVAVGESLLGIVGGDPQNIQRKNLPTLFAVPLPVKITLFSNEIPTMFDSSGALASRFLTLRMTRTFFDREDIELKNKIRDELPGILNWAIEGLNSLNMIGRFIEPESSRQLAKDIADTYSPIRVFVQDCCTVEPCEDGRTLQTPKGMLYGWWRRWCDLQGIEKPGSINIFFRNLKAAFPDLADARPRVPNPDHNPDHNPDRAQKTSRETVIIGIGLARDPDG